MYNFRKLQLNIYLYIVDKLHVCGNKGDQMAPNLQYFNSFYFYLV